MNADWAVFASRIDSVHDITVMTRQTLRVVYYSEELYPVPRRIGAEAPDTLDPLHDSSTFAAMLLSIQSLQHHLTFISMSNSRNPIPPNWSLSLQVLRGENVQIRQSRHLGAFHPTHARPQSGWGEEVSRSGLT